MESRELESINKVVERISNHFIATGLTDDYNQYCSHDVDLTGVTTNGTYTAALEVKERNFSINELKQYSKEGLMIERIKYDHLMKQKNPMYANYFNNNKFELILIWNMTNVKNLKQKDLVCSKTTQFANTDKVTKDTLLLSIDECSLIFIKYKDVVTEFPWHKSNIKHIKKYIENM